MTADKERDAARIRAAEDDRRAYAAMIALRLERQMNRIVDDETTEAAAKRDALWALYRRETTLGKRAMKALAFEMLAGVR